MQCLESPYKLELCGLDPLELHRPDRMQDNNETNLINILKVIKCPFRVSLIKCDNTLIVSLLIEQSNG